MNKYTPVIGLEIHVELKTKSKMFCQCDADFFDKKPNSNTCPVCLGMPGALPVPNRTAVEWAIKIGQALGCSINKQSKFDRKHYFYPDLPKAYQISQYDEPLAEHGQVILTPSPRGKNPVINKRMDPSVTPQDDKSKIFRITRVHLEEDTGKLTHTGKDTLVDFNRSGVPLVEIVTEPDFDNSVDVKIFLEELHTIIRYLDVSDANMEEGSMRLEPNISLRKTLNPKSEIRNNIKIPNNKQKFELPNYKVEVKNINSFNFAKRAIEYEIKRQAKILDKGETPAQETRGYDDKKGVTFSQRSKEEAQDYRYFPEPDIPPMVFSDEEIESIRKTLPELPHEKLARFMKEYRLKYADAFILTRNIQTALYFESICADTALEQIEVPDKSTSSQQLVANVMVNKRIPTRLPQEEFLQKLIKLYKPVEVDEEKLTQVIDHVIAQHPTQVAQYKGGKMGLIGFFIGQVMKEMKGKADPKTVRKKIHESLDI